MLSSLAMIMPFTPVIFWIIGIKSFQSVEKGSSATDFVMQQRPASDTGFLPAQE
jgi:hypothetical protein